MSNLILTIIFTSSIFLFFLLLSIPKIIKFKSSYILKTIIDDSEKIKNTKPKYKNQYNKSTSLVKSKKIRKKNNKPKKNTLNQVSSDPNEVKDAENKHTPAQNKIKSPIKSPIKDTTKDIETIYVNDTKDVDTIVLDSSSVSSISNDTTNTIDINVDNTKDTVNYSKNIEDDVDKFISELDINKSNIFNIIGDVKITANEIDRISGVIGSSNNLGFVIQITKSSKPTFSWSRVILNLPINNLTDLNKVKSEIIKYKDINGIYDTYLIWESTIEKIKLNSLIGYNPT